MSNRVNPLDGAIADLNAAPKVDIRGKQYSQVATRVEVFRRHFGLELAILTEIIEATTDHVIIKATIATQDGTPIATGMAEEVRGSSAINKTSALENCETSAIGRAMAAFGLHGGEYATADEVTQAIAQQNGASKEVRVKRGAEKSDAPSATWIDQHVIVHGPDDGGWSRWHGDMEAQLLRCEAAGNVGALVEANQAAITTYKAEHKDDALRLSASFQARKRELAQAAA